MDIKPLRWWTLVLILIGCAVGLMREAPPLQGNVPSVWGGPEETSLARLKSLENRYSLKLVFAPTGSGDLNDVNVKITDARGRVLFERAGDAPIVMVKLPSGTYSVSATHGDATETRQFQVTGTLQTEHFHWAAAP